MDFEKLAKHVEKISAAAEKIAETAKKTPDDLKGNAIETSKQAMKTFMQTSREILMMFLKDRKEQIRAGHLFRDAAAKNIVPGDAADRGDALLIRWGGNVTPNDPRAVHDDAVKANDLASRLVPVFKAYQKEEKKA